MEKLLWLENSESFEVCRDVIYRDTWSNIIHYVAEVNYGNYSIVNKSIYTVSEEIKHIHGEHIAHNVYKLGKLGLKMDVYWTPSACLLMLCKSGTVPDFTLHDLYNYVITSKSIIRDLKPYKSLDAYQYFLGQIVQWALWACNLKPQIIKK